MDRELAGAVFQRLVAGYPVAETTLYKAASVIGVDPHKTVLEARYNTLLSNHLMGDKEPLNDKQREFMSVASGNVPGEVEKVASAYKMDPDYLIIRSLSEHSFFPDLEKLAMLAPMQEGEGDPSQAAQQQQMGGQGEAQDPQQAMQQDPTQAVPQPGAMVQQPAGFRPSPTAPEQVPPSESGNLEQLLAGVQQAHQGQAEANGGMPPSGMPEPPPPPPTPEERIQQVAPGMDEATTARYAEKLQEFEQRMQMPIQDPKQMVKFVTELQKADKKVIDQGIKQMAEEMTQEMGLNQVQPSPTVPGFGSNQQQNPQAGQAAGQQQPKQQPQQPKQPPATSNAVEKVAHAARRLAHAFYTR